MRNDQFINKDSQVLKWLPWIILLFAYPAILAANYALIFHLKASIISWISILICCSGLIINLQFPSKANPNLTLEGLKNKYSAYFLIWTGISWYTLNFIFIVLIMMVLSVFIESSYRKKVKSTLFQNEIKTGVFSWLISPASCSLPTLSHLKTVLKNDFLIWIWVSAAYLYLDLIRQYSVWHEIQFRILPTLLFVIAILMGLTRKTLSRKND
ncbi:hypothetical protein BH11BAC2_BH11BAC2_12870 [soil metagenome]